MNNILERAESDIALIERVYGLKKSYTLLQEDKTSNSIQKTYFRVDEMGDEIRIIILASTVGNFRATIRMKINEWENKRNFSYLTDDASYITWVYGGKIWHISEGFED